MTPEEPENKREGESEKPLQLQECVSAVCVCVCVCPASEQTLLETHEYEPTELIRSVKNCARLAASTDVMAAERLCVCARACACVRALTGL